MKLSPIILIAIVLITSQCAGVKTEKANTNADQFLIVSYNVENLFDTKNDPHNSGDDEFLPTNKKEWTQKRYEKKLFDLAKREEYERMNK